MLLLETQVPGWLIETIELVNNTGVWLVLLISLAFNLLLLFLFGVMRSGLILERWTIKLKIFEAEYKRSDNKVIQSLTDNLNKAKADIRALQKERYATYFAFLLLQMIIGVSNAVNGALNKFTKEQKPLNNKISSLKNMRDSIMELDDETFDQLINKQETEREKD